MPKPTSTSTSTSSPPSTPPGAGAAGRPSREWIGWGLAVVLPLALYPLMRWIGTPIPGAFFTAVLGAMGVLWVFSLVDEFIPPLFATVAMLFVGLAPPSIALAGFASSSLLTLVGVFALSAVINATGLGQRLMFWLLLRLPDRPFWHQTVLLVGGYLMSPIMPSGNSRLAIMLPMFRNMADGCRLAPGGRAITGLMAASFAGSMLFSPMMSTSKSSNIAAIALLPQQVQTEFLGIFWLVAAGVAALGLTLLHVVALRLVFGNGRQDPLPRQDLEEQLARRGPMGPDEWVAAACFAFFLVGATTVSWHHVQPAWLAGFVLVGLLVTGVMGKQGFRGQIDWPMIFFLLGLDSVTRVMGHVGLDTGLAQAMGDLYGFIDGRFPMFILASLLTTLAIRLVLPLTAGMIVSTIVLLPVAATEGIHPWLCVFLTALFSDIWFFRHQSSVYLQAVSSGETARVDEPAFLRHNHLMNLARVLVAYASIPWWHWLGLL